MKIVLDTNILISAIGWGGKPLQLLELCIENKLQLILSDDILDEIKKVLSRDKFKNIKDKEEFIIFLKEISTIINPNLKLNICRDKKDNMFIEAAIASNSKYIISGDKDLLSLKQYKNIKIITVDKFI